MSRMNEGVSQPKRKVKVLVVEDAALVALDLQHRLEKQGYEVVGPIARLSVAIELASTADFDLAVLDIDISGKPVFPVAEVLQRSGIPFIFATGFGAPDLPPEFQNCPRVEKPYRIEELYELLDSMFHAASRARESAPA